MAIIQQLLILNPHAVQEDKTLRTQLAEACIPTRRPEKHLISPMQYAVRNKNKLLLLLLQEHGAELNPSFPDDLLEWTICSTSIDEWKPLSPLQEAINEADKDISLLLVIMGADISDRWFPALPIAAKNGDLRSCEFLCKLGANLNSVPPMNAIQVAAASGNVDVTDYLITLGADINAPAGPGPCGVTALQAAVQHGHFKMASMLLEKGADINANKRSVSALQRALRNQNEDLVGLLSSYTPGLDLADNYYESEVPDAWWNPEIMDPLVGESGLHDLPRTQRNPARELSRDQNANSYESLLQSLVCARDIKAVNAQLGAGADIGSCPKILPLAAESGSIELVKRCIDAGIESNTEDEYGGTALHHAAASGNLDMMRLLLDSGAGIDYPDYCPGPVYRTALCIAAEEGHFHAAVLLLGAGANLNFAPAAFSRTPLETAALYGRMDIAQLFLQANRDLGKLRADCRRAALFAGSSNHLELAKSLDEKYAQLGSLGYQEDNSVVLGRDTGFLACFCGKENWK